jgi:hypothetical protein
MLALALTLSALVPQEPLRANPREVERTVRDLVGFGTRQVLSATEDPERGTGAARTYLERRFAALVEPSGGRLRVERQAAEVDCRRRGMPARVPVVNILATLPGTSDPERIYVIGGHYDSINGDGADGERPAPGANDDASGTAAVLEACRLLCGREFAATIVFCAYDGEEQGLLGSKAHAEALAAAGAMVDGMITNDIVGNTMGMDGVRRDRHLRVFSYAPRGEDSLGRSLARAASWASRRVDGLEVMLVFRGDRYGRGGDHRSFFEQGWPAVRFTEPREDFSRQHQDVSERDGRPYGDLPEFMDFDYLARVASLDAELLAELASAPRAPGRVRISGARDRYDTVVQFDAVEAAAAYEVVWRLTTAADWEGQQLVPAAGLDFEGRRGARVVLEGTCIDDVVVGVRAVSAAGARSRVTAAPEPDAMVYRSTPGEGR